MAANDEDKITGGRVREMRIQHEITQEELAARMRGKGYKWSKPTVSAVENGERPLKLQEAADLMRVFDQSPQMVYRLVTVSTATLTDHLRALRDDCLRCMLSMRAYADSYRQVVRKAAEEDAAGELPADMREQVRKDLETWGADRLEAGLRASLAKGTEEGDDLTDLPEEWARYLNPTPQS